MQLDIVEEDKAWLKNSLVGQIANGVNYQCIKRGLIDSGVIFSGFRYMGASQALISFDSLKMALDMDSQAWKTYFEAPRPWKSNWV